MSSKPTDTLRMLEGKTIKTVHINGVNSVTFETDDGDFQLEVESVLPQFNVYGIQCTKSQKILAVKE